MQTIKHNIIRACHIDTFRYTTTLPTLIPHKTVHDTEVGGYKIPANTAVWVNAWGLAHDESLWGDPFVFRPDRYHDDNGDLVLADHPNRVNMLAFGAGPRVCVGETVAKTRMFLMLAMFMQRFVILPATTIAQQPSCDCRHMVFGILLSQPEYKIRLILRHD